MYAMVCLLNSQHQGITMIKFLLGNVISELVAKELEKERVDIDKKINERCGELIISLFDETEPLFIYDTNNRVLDTQKRTVKGQVVRAVTAAALDALTQDEVERINKLIGSEGFIDDIVSRINRKQVK